MWLQALGVTDMEIKNMAQLMDFGPRLSLKEKNNGNTKNNDRRHSESISLYIDDLLHQL